MNSIFKNIKFAKPFAEYYRRVVLIGCHVQNNANILVSLQVKYQNHVNYKVFPHI